MSIFFVCVFVCVFPFLKGNQFEEIAYQYIELISSKPLDMDKIEKMETEFLHEVLTEETITDFMLPFKNFDKILFSKEVNGTVPGYHFIETAARYNYSIQKYDFAFNIIWHIVIGDNDNLIASLKYFYNWTAPSYANTSSFYEIQNIFVGPFKLPGTLTMPKYETPKGIILLIQGSGSSDEDESYLGMKPFKDIAWGLATKGIAVFRYPKRYYLHPPKYNNETIEQEYMIDCQAAIDLLYHKFNTPIIPIGHSEGGKIVALLTERKLDKIKGFATLAGQVQHMVSTSIRQYKYLAKVNNHTLDHQDYKNLKDMEKVETLLEEGKLPDDYILPEPLKNFNPAYLKSLFAVDNVGITNSFASSSDHHNNNMKFLVTNGDKDYQVTLKTDLYVWEKNNTNPNVQFKVFQGIDHFQNLVVGTPVPWDYETPQNVFPEIIDTLSDFIKSF